MQLEQKVAKLRQFAEKGTRPTKKLKEKFGLRLSRRENYSFPEEKELGEKDQRS